VSRQLSKNSICFGLLMALGLLIAGCSSKPYMGQGDFDTVRTGASISTVIESYGQPDIVQDARLSGKGDEYIYIDRIEVSRDITEHGHYVFRVVDGVVVDKWVDRVESTYPEWQIN